MAEGKLFLYTAKTGTAVYCPLPEAVAGALGAIPTTNNKHHFFWTGESEPKSAVGDWQRSLRKLFALANVAHGHAHRFRDTFAVELLLEGVPLERVSVLLGHQSTRITEKHYSPWVRARQEQLEADVRRTWAAGLVAQAASKVTQKLRGKEMVNYRACLQRDTMVEAAGVEPASENVTGQETTCLVEFPLPAFAGNFRSPRSEPTRNARH